MYETNFKETQDKVADLQRKLKIATDALERAKSALRPFVQIYDEMPDVVRWLPDRFAKKTVRSGDIHQAKGCLSGIAAALAEIEKGDV